MTDAACQTGGALDCGGSEAHCINNVCVDDHLTQVASRVSAYQNGSGMVPNGDFHASQVTFYIEHNRTSPTAYPNSTQLGDAFSWFDSNDVKLVNCSLGRNAGEPSSGHGTIAVYFDYFARSKGFIPVMGSGNKKPSDAAHPLDTVSCEGFNTICVGGMDYAPNDPENRAKFIGSPIARWRNIPDNDWEFEKPDVSADSDFAHVAKMNHPLGGTTEWDTLPGTSFSVPTVTGLIALHLDFCRGVPGTRDSAFYRALLRSLGSFDPTEVELYTAAGGSFTPSCPFSPPSLYPAVALSCDHHGGAGPVSAKYLFESRDTCAPIENPHCSGPTCIIGGSGTLTSDGWSGVPSWAQTGDPGPDNLTQAVDLELKIPSAQFQTLSKLGSYGARERFRATFAYYSCADLLTPASMGGVAVDFDFALIGHNRSTGMDEVIAASEAADDATEGFDVTFRDDYDDVALWVVGPDPSSSNWQPCNGVKSEPYAWWAIWN